MGQDLPFLIEQHPAIGTSVEEANAIVLGESSVITSLDHLELPQPDRNQKEGDSQNNEKDIILSLKVLHFLGVQFHSGLSLSSNRHLVSLHQDMSSLAKQEEQGECEQGRTEGLGKKSGQHGRKKVA